jgi:hypothetical protein
MIGSLDGLNSRLCGVQCAGTTNRSGSLGKRAAIDWPMWWRGRPPRSGNTPQTRVGMLVFGPIPSCVGSQQTPTQALVPRPAQPNGLARYACLEMLCVSAAVLAGGALKQRPAHDPGASPSLLSCLCGEEQCAQCPSVGPAVTSCGMGPTPLSPAGTEYIIYQPPTISAHISPAPFLPLLTILLRAAAPL